MARFALRCVLFGMVVCSLLAFSSGVSRAQQPPPADPSFETPRKAMELFAEAAGRGDFLRASDALDLHLLRADLRKAKGPELARQIWVVLERAVWIDLDAIPDEPRPKADEKSYRITVVPLRGREVPITLTATIVGKDPRWSISSATVSMAPQLYEQYGPGPIEARLPASIRDPRLGWLHIWQWVGLVFALFAGWALGRAVAAVVGFFVRRLAARTAATWDDELVVRLTSPTRLFLGLIAFRVLVEPLAFSAAALYATETCLKVALFGVIGFAAVRIVTVVARNIEAHAVATGTSGTGAMRARGVTTQVRVLRRLINIGVGILTIALMLIQFETVRNVGVSLLASAGLAGVVLGFAAQRTIGSLIAGIQLSATSLVRIGDEVVVEKEFGSIEEITLTYVVVKIWDERRLVVPMTRFLEQSFENWTRLSANLHGTVFLEVDPTLPVSLVRAELDRVIGEGGLWDGRTKKVHVIDAKERSMQLRVLVSAGSASDLFDLRAHVRERMLAWLASFEGGRYLVRTRVEDPLPPEGRRNVPARAEA